MTGVDIPPALPDSVKREVQNAVLTVRNNSSNQIASALSIISQPTGNPQNLTPQAAMPTGMLGNNMDFANRMMPHTSSYTEPPQFKSLSSSVEIPWAVTAEEKKQYTKVFKAWDPENKGSISGETAKEIFSQSGLPQNVLMQIWSLSDPNNQGKLNLNEFAVAMHLLYRKLNGYNLPETLPPDLVPLSTRDLTDTVSKLKQTILDDIAKKRYIKNFSSSPELTLAQASSPSRTATKKKEVADHDVEVGYVSSARRMGPDRTRSRDPSTAVTSSSYGYRGKTTRIFDLRKEIEGQKKALQELEQEKLPKSATPYNELSALDKKSIDETKEKIEELQTEISRSGNEHGQDMWGVYIQKSTELSSVADEEKSLAEEAKYLLDTTLSRLLAQLNETEDDLMNKKIQAINQTNSSANTDPPLDIVGTGPGGAITESDRIRAKAKAMVAARMGKITGKAKPNNKEAEIDKIKKEHDEFKFYTDSVQDSIRETSETLRTIELEMNMIGLDIRKQDQDQKRIEERKQFEFGENVAGDLKTFISELKYNADLAKAPEIDPSFESRFPVF
ncbi:hypothetical protein BY458DRAFT_535763 [Sporodiniella umbellata]|nr:hypothetical protein BY458DRAFT_535763 [Sporodiniella umbellata]